MRGLPRLDPSALRRLGGSARPGLAERPAVGIVHLGIGAFHRAHQAVYTAEAIERAGGDWGILGVAQRRPAAVDALVPQDGLFSVARPRAGGGRRHRLLAGPRRPARAARARSPDRGARRPRRPRGHADRDRARLPARPRHRRPAAGRSRGRLRPRRRRAAHARSASSRAASPCARPRGEAGPLTIVLLRQPAAQRRGARPARARLLRPHGRRRPPRWTGSTATRASRARWSTASCPPPRPPTARRSPAGSGSRTAARSWPSRSASG